MRGTVKWFNKTKGYGFITDSDGKDHFVHHSNIQMEGLRSLDTDDIVEFEIGIGTKNREQAVNVKPFITRKDVTDILRSDGWVLKPIKDAYGNGAYMVVDENNVIQAGEHGLSLIEVAAYAGIDTEGLE